MTHQAVPKSPQPPDHILGHVLGEHHPLEALALTNQAVLQPPGHHQDHVLGGPHRQEVQAVLCGQGSEHLQQSDSCVLHDNLNLSDAKHVTKHVLSEKEHVQLVSSVSNKQNSSLKKKTMFASQQETGINQGSISEEAASESWPS